MGLFLMAGCQQGSSPGPTFSKFKSKFNNMFNLV